MSIIYPSPPHLDNSGEDVHEGDEDEVVQRGGVGHLGKVLPSLEAHEGHGEHRGDAQRDPVRGGLSVEPERDPGDHDQQHTGAIHLSRLGVWSLGCVVRYKIYLNNKVPHVPLEMEAHQQG